MLDFKVQEFNDNLQMWINASSIFSPVLAEVSK